MNDDPQFDSCRSDAWRKAIVDAARADLAGRRSSRNRATIVVSLVVASLGVSGGGVAYALSTHLLTPQSSLGAASDAATPAIPERDTPTVTPAPTPTQPPTPTEPAETPDYTVLGFDASQLFDLCQSAVRNQYSRWETSYPGMTQFQALAPDSLRDAQEDGIGHVAIFAPSAATTPEGYTTVWICEFSGDPANPTMEYASFADK